MKVITITGGSDGIGAEIARQLARTHGGAVALVLAARKRDLLEQVAAACTALGAQALAVLRRPFARRMPPFEAERWVLPERLEIVRRAHQIISGKLAAGGSWVTTKMGSAAGRLRHVSADVNYSASTRRPDEAQETQVHMPCSRMSGVRQTSRCMGWPSCTWV